MADVLLCGFRILSNGCTDGAGVGAGVGVGTGSIAGTCAGVGAGVGFGSGFITSEGEPELLLEPLLLSEPEEPPPVAIFAIGFSS